VSDDRTGEVAAGAVLAAFMERVGGRGSGKANFAQGGGGDPAAVAGAIEAAGALIDGARLRVAT
jgi:alanyl-tRNA synthetase